MYERNFGAMFLLSLVCPVVGVIGLLVLAVKEYRAE